jgi:type I restriction enzyme S subunit
MELRLGHTQTEAGAIPEDWRVIELGEEASFRTGPFGSALHKSDYTFDGVPVINPMHLVDGRILPTPTMTITEGAAQQLSDFRLRPQDIIIGRRGEMGRCAVVRDNNAGWLCGTGSMIMRSTKKLDPDFLQRVLASPTSIAAIESSSVGSTMINLNQSVLSRLRILCPPLAEQRTIAEALNDADALIASLEQLIAKKRFVKRGAMQELLTGRKRLPEYNGVWDLKPLGDIAEVVMGQSPSSQNYNSRGDGLPLIQGNADILDRETIKRVFTTEVTKRGRRGDVLLSVRAPVGEVSRAMFDVCLGRGVCAIRYPNDFLYHALIASELDWARLSKGSTFDSVTSTDVKEFVLAVPDDEAEQRAIAGVLNEMNAEIHALESQVAKSREMKHGMMQELLTGGIRLA